MFSTSDLSKKFAEIIRRIRLLEIRGNTGIVKTGVDADLPVTPDVSSGSTTSFYAYDTKKLYIWNTNSSAWDEVTFT